MVAVDGATGRESRSGWGSEGVSMQQGRGTGRKGGAHPPGVGLGAPVPRVTAIPGGLALGLGVCVR